MASVQVMVNGQPSTVASDGAFSTVAALQTGANTLTIVATDAAGNVTRATRSVRVNTVAPTLSVTVPQAFTNVAQLAFERHGHSSGSTGHGGCNRQW